MFFHVYFGVLIPRQDLFNAAFLTIWNNVYDELWEGDKSHLPIIYALESALSSSSLPPAIQTQLVCLAGFMELNGNSLSLDTNFLASKALQSNELAQFLHYTEAEFIKCSPDAPKIDETVVDIEDYSWKGDLLKSIAMNATGGTGGTGAGASQNSRRRLQVRTDSVTSAMESEVAAGKGGWEGAPTMVSTGGTTMPESVGVPDAVGAVNGESGTLGTVDRSDDGNIGPSPDTLEALISVNHKLGLDKAAAGILRQAEVQALNGKRTLEVRPSWLEKLMRWSDALRLYEDAIKNCEACLTVEQVGVPSPRAPLTIGAGGGGLSDQGLGGAHTSGYGHRFKPVSLHPGLVLPAPAAAPVQAGTELGMGASGDVAPPSRPSSMSSLPRPVVAAVATAAAASSKVGARGEDLPLAGAECLPLWNFNTDEAFGGREQTTAEKRAAIALAGSNGFGGYAVSLTDIVVEW